MLKIAQYRVLSILGALSLVLVIANIALTRVNQALQSEVSARNRTLQQSVQLESLYQEIGRALGALAVQNKDEKLRAMLAQEGIKVAASGQPPAGGARK